MNRTIKFRAWDGKKMLDNPKFEFFSHGRNGRAVMMANEDEFVEIMQFTGLLDKNGKEIWEGDVLSYRSKEKERSAVFFDGGCFKVEQRSSSSIRSAGHHLEKYECEVIGNIYENPDLIA